MKAYINTKRALKRWLLRSLQPCEQMVPLMSESMESPLGLSEWVQLKLHLIVCAWCARYLKQIKFIRQLLHEKHNAESAR